MNIIISYAKRSVQVPFLLLSMLTSVAVFRQSRLANPGDAEHSFQ